jgi:hypothetical protein
MIFIDCMGHLFSNKSAEELYEFAVKKLGLKPEWNHYSHNFPHFDVTTPRRRQIAIRTGARLIPDDTTLILEKHHEAEQVFKDIVFPLVNGKGLFGQSLRRIDFVAYFKQKQTTRFCPFCDSNVAVKDWDELNQMCNACVTALDS